MCSIGYWQLPAVRLCGYLTTHMLEACIFTVHLDSKLCLNGNVLSQRGPCYGGAPLGAIDERTASRSPQPSDFLLVGKVRLAALGVGLDRLAPGLPPGWAHLDPQSIQLTAATALAT